MAKSRSKKLIQRDRFNNLPRNVQEIILDRLSIKDAVRTSMVSRKWRRSWTVIPRLIFDCQFLMIIRPKLSCYQDSELKTREFLSVINNILLLHNGPLLKFSFGFLEHCDAQMIGDQIKQWIPLLYRKKLKQLTLQNFHQFTGCYRYDFDPNNFSCLKLTHLKLRCAYLPEIGAFTNLTNLKLVGCHGPVLTECIFQCPKLERLTLKGCFNVYHTYFRAPKLKHLDIEAYELPLEGLETIIEFAFFLRILGDRLLEAYDVAIFLGCFHKVEKLTIGDCSVKFLALAGAPDRDPQPLPYLKSLNISFVDFTESLDISCMLYIIRSAPYLCNLEIEGCLINSGDRESVKNYELEDSQKCNLNNLEYVKFSYVEGLKTDIELIKFIAEYSPLLKKMVIHSRWGTKLDLVVQEMKGFPVASPVANICFISDL